MTDQIAALLAQPALTAPDGVTPNFDNPPNRNGLAWFVTTFCMVVATICLCLRLYVRLWVVRKVQVEEVLMVLAYGAYWATAYAGYGLIYTPGYYVHQWNLTYGQLVQPFYLILVYGSAYSACLPLLKSAILIEWCRVFVAGDRYKSSFWWGSMVVISIQAIWGVACIILLNMQCVPHAAIWEFYLPSKCYSLPKVMLTSASVQVFSDFCMALLPQKVIWGLQMNWQKRMGVAIIFGVGALACVAASVRLATTVTFAQEADQMYFIAPLLFWACAEMTCGFFILSVPWLPKIFSESELSRTFKKCLGLGLKSSTSPLTSNPNTKPGLSSHKLSRSGLGTDESKYYKMDEDGVPMTIIGPSESQEHLQEDRFHGQTTSNGRKGVMVTRTTQVTYASDKNSAGDRPYGESITPWAS